MTTQATRKRATTDELIAKQKEKLQQLQARKRREQAREREARKAQERKKRARILISIGALFTEWLKKLHGDVGKEKWVNSVFTTDIQTKDKECREDRKQEAQDWLRQEIGLPPAPAPAQAQDKPAAPAQDKPAAPVSAPAPAQDKPAAPAAAPVSQ